jgi:hypothetical protein
LLTFPGGRGRKRGFEGNEKKNVHGERGEDTSTGNLLNNLPCEEKLE